ncbi:MAG: phospholipase D-like domain-containing protein [Patescibacteria group bacterium]
MNSSLPNSQLHDEKTFYQTFLRDLEGCTKEVIIESPYITTERMRTFDRLFHKLLKRGVKIYIITRDPKEHEVGMEVQSEDAITWCETIGVQVLLCVGNHHRKLAILDRKILYEGSLNILSQTWSREIMRRMEDPKLAVQMFDFLKLGKFL